MWPHAIVAAVGFWLMASPDVLGIPRPAATNAWIVGPTIVSFAAIAWWGATRPVRWVNVLLGAWLLLAPFVISHEWTATLNSAACGAACVLFSSIRGSINHRFDGGWGMLLGSPSPAPASSTR